jgi:hypothetical protein
MVSASPADVDDDTAGFTLRSASTEADCEAFGRLARDYHEYLQSQLGVDLGYQVGACVPTPSQRCCSSEARFESGPD